jgi:hypothetical protein
MSPLPKCWNPCARGRLQRRISLFLELVVVARHLSRTAGCHLLAKRATEIKMMINHQVFHLTDDIMTTMQASLDNNIMGVVDGERWSDAYTRQG